LYSRPKDKSVEIDWLIEGSKDRIVKIGDQVVFRQTSTDIGGEFAVPFDNLSLQETWGGHCLSREKPFVRSNDNAAPLLCARQYLATHSRGKRLRRRGPRSNLAILRRSVPKQRRALPGMSPGESGDTMPVNTMYCTPQKVVNNDSIFDKSESPASNSCHKGISVYSVNIRCLLAHKAELEFVLSVKPSSLSKKPGWTIQRSR
jgi:hypothetical protein